MENLSPSPNPFENHLVIERILKHVHFEELKAVRHLNSFWNQLASPHLEQKAWIHLSQANIDDFIRFQSRSQYIEDEDENEIDKSRTAPLKFRNFYLKSASLNLGAQDSSASKFFTRHGRDVEEIVLDTCVFTFQSDAAKLVGECLPNCKTLSISAPIVEPGLEEESSDEDFKSPTQFSQNWSIKNLEIIPGIDSMKIAWWGQIFQMLPGLRSLNVQCRNTTDVTHMLDALLNASPQLSKLGEFSSFVTELTDHHLRQLVHLNRPYTMLDLNLCPSVSWQGLHDLLAACQKSLKSLKLFHGSLPKDFEQFPVEGETGFPYGLQLNSLERLELIGDMVDSFGFLKNVPRLSKLSVLNPNDENENEDGLGLGSLSMESLLIENTDTKKVDPHCNLRSLSIEYSLRPVCVRKLGTWLAPNLNSLSMYLDDDSIRAVFSSMNNLEELSVLGIDVTDEGLTGIGLEDLLVTAHDDLQLLRKRRNFPFIGDCSKLRKFSLYPQPQENISDYSVHLGLMLAKELNMLDLPMTAISDEGIESLQSKPNLAHLSCKYFVEDGQVCKRPLHLQNLQRWHRVSVCNDNLL